MRLFKNVVAQFILPLGWEDFIGQASPVNEATTKCPNLNKKLNSLYLNKREVITV
jgi:hypothetical protein